MVDERASPRECVRGGIVIASHIPGSVFSTAAMANA
jgi:hypothetical protein